MTLYCNICDPLKVTVKWRHGIADLVGKSVWVVVAFGDKPDFVSFHVDATFEYKYVWATYALVKAPEVGVVQEVNLETYAFYGEKGGVKLDAYVLLCKVEDYPEIHVWNGNFGHGTRTIGIKAADFYEAYGGLQKYDFHDEWFEKELEVERGDYPCYFCGCYTA